MATLLYDIRTPFPLPSHPDGGLGASAAIDEGRAITLRHPGYPDQSNIMLVFPALDPLPILAASSVDATTVHFGFHHETARIACAIVANCRWDGFLSEEKQGQAKPVSLGPDDILPARNYYFHVPPDTDILNKYPTVPSFGHFQFPHNNLPSFWTSLRFPRPQNLPRLSSFDQAVLARDVSCRISRNTLGTETAHLVPRAEEVWFSMNQMSQYSSQPEALGANATDDVRNAILLRSDLHGVFDQRRFALVPKAGVWVIHTLSGLPSDELASLYHNVTLQPLCGLAVEYVFARFAWTVLAQGTFLRAGVPRRLVVVEGEENVMHVKNVSGLECRTKFVPTLAVTKSRSQSPKKRARDDVDEDNELEEILYDDEDKGDENMWNCRGRQRKRRNGGPISLPTATNFNHWRDMSPQEELFTYST
ncbi:hypothetical protein F4810DRAFT_679862 [Camillea tinctor]|nr:hypothetical protein F4810DRAFT_679862 [Camillea tinctor]